MEAGGLTLPGNKFGCL